MYNVSEAYRTAIRKNTRKYAWSGVVTAADGKTYPFEQKDIVSGSGSLTRSCSGDKDLELGSVYASELDISLFTAVDRYTLYGGSITLAFTLTLADGSKETVPVGVFTIWEATRTSNVLNIKAYDAMLAFDKNIGAVNGLSRTPYQWLLLICMSCNVPLGMTESQVSALTNGSRKFTLVQTDDIKTYRDLLSHVACVLCGVAQIDRSGSLLIRQFLSAGAENIPAGRRFSSTLADYITRYTGMYATYIIGALTEYFHETPDDGLIYNIGTNALLQISDDTARHAAVQAILDQLATVRYTPFDAELPCDPSFDPTDLLVFSGGHADGETACITELVIQTSGKMRVKCVGENPRLNQAKSRYTKDIEGLLDANQGIEGTSTFWLSDAYSPADFTITNTPQVVTATSFEIKTDMSKGDINFTAYYVLSTAAVITAVVYLDNRVHYTLKEWHASGDGVLTITSPFSIERGDDGVHECRVEIFCEDEERPSGDLPIASAETLGGVKVGSGLSIAQDGTLSTNGASYQLPAATGQTLGGVKVGSGLSVTQDGTLSADGYVLPAATDQTLGGIIVGDGLAITNGVLRVSYPNADVEEY